MTIYFSENLKALRKSRGLTQDDLANYLGVSFQAVSKWERNESYPDITILPEIADFFGVGLEELLGIDKAKKEQELDAYIEEYDHYLNDAEKQEELIERLIKEYPSDFRVKLRYMVTLFKKKDKETFDKINQLYDSIMSFCTDDSIRISAKNQLAHYYHSISYFNPELGITDKDVDKILDEMPSMEDGREFIRSYLNPQDSPACLEYSRDAVELEIYFLYHGLYHLVFFANRYDFPDEYLIEVLEKVVNLTEFCFDDGHYGRMWRNMFYLRWKLAEMYFNKNEAEKGYYNLEKLVKSAKRFDEMDRVTVMHSKMFDGREFDKNVLGSTYVATMQIKEKLSDEQFNIPDEYRNSERFKEILSILK